ncbi:DUF5132 domain-containing protein [Streptomyces sp. NBC_01481]|uniref:DUF5132 domain-containing protein n=1 Tax=Streptomyces sp. NBC_01481 TaxID=2975869 RepID=UPI002251ABCC|nr:DUF5132 domain-containing protein [Streptomyces sp. NBC_01481]MCX4587277.1 DUF5132 domain-containing protein [Streptomyces sp. NBC_01481]
MPPVVPPFLIGLIAAPLARRVAKPLLRGIVKTSVGLVLEVKRAASEANEGIQDLAAEVSAEVIAAQMARDARLHSDGEVEGHDDAGGDGDAAPHGAREAKGSAKPRAATIAAKGN